MEAAFDRVISKRLETASSRAAAIAADLRAGNLDIESSVDRALAAIQQARGVKRIKGEYKLLGIPEDDSLDVPASPILAAPAIIEPRVMTPAIEAPAKVVEPLVIPPDSIAHAIASRARRQGPSLAQIKSWHRSESRLRDEHPGYSPPRSLETTWNFMSTWRSTVVYEDKAVIAVNKPVGVISHYTALMPVGVEEVLRAGIGDHVRLGHRLDRETSGLIFAGKTDAGLAGLVYQFMAKSRGGGSMRKFYLALLDGLVEGRGAIDVNIRLEATPDRRMRVVQDGVSGREALSHVLPLAVLSDGKRVKTLAQFEIVTGLTHQIRKTAEHMGAPVEGDDYYNDRFMQGQRLMLHSLMMELANPITGEPMVVTAPLPEDFRVVLGGLRVQKAMGSNIKESVLHKLPKSEAVFS